jgi:hypothetical protein
MNQGKYVFSQLIGLVSHKQFQTLVKRHKGDYKVKDFSCWNNFYAWPSDNLRIEKV